MLVATPLIIDGELWGTVFHLEHEGDVFPTHTHTEDDIHITVLAFGSIRCMGRPEIEGKVLRAKPGGTVVNWKPHEAHGFVALEDGATLVNILKRRPQ